MKSRFTTPVIVSTLLLAALLLVGAMGAVGSTQWACRSCHPRYAQAQQHTAHASTRCASCHGGGVVGTIALAGRVVTQMVPGRIVGSRVSGPVIELPRGACLSCHKAVTRSGAASSQGLRIDHSTCATGPTCDTCHSTTAHGSVTRWKRGPVMEDCTACHARQDAPLACTTCHSGRTSGQRIATTGPWQVTHGANWKSTHGMGKLDSCVTCHPKDYCVQCHKVEVPHGAEFGSTHGESAKIDRAACLTCHKTERFCNACHGIAMPHPASFMKAHPVLVKDSGSDVCLRCHTQDTCDRCHIAHVHPGYNGVHKPTQPGTGAGAR